MEAAPPAVALRSFLDFLRDVGGGGPAPVLVAHNAHKFDAVVLARNLMEHGLVEEASRCISVCVNDINISVYGGEITHLEHLPSRAPLTWPTRQVSYWDRYSCALLHCQNAKFSSQLGIRGSKRQTYLLRRYLGRPQSQVHGALSDATDLKELLGAMAAE